jgi:PAS domain S-box-containing protein
MASPSDGDETELGRLIQTLHEAQQRIQVLTGGAVDAVSDLASGSTYLLPVSQAHLRRSETEQRHFAVERAAILNALPAHIALLDRDGNIVAVNEAWRRFALVNLCSRDDLGVGWNYLEVCDRARGDRSTEASAMARGIRAVLAGKAADFAVEYPCPSPTAPRWFRATVTPLDRGGTGGAVVMHMNVTELKLASEAVRASSERFRGAFRDAVTGMTIVDTAGRFLESNDAFCRMMGYSEDELKTRDVSSVTHPDDWPESKRLIASLLAGERRGYNLEKRQLTKSGAIVWCRVSVSANRDAADRPTELIAIVEDISERKLAQLARDETETRFRQLADTIEDVFWLTDANQNYLYLSPAFERIWGRPVQDFYRNPDLWSASIVDEDRSNVLAAWKGSKYGKFDMEDRIQRPDGTVHWVADRGFPVLDDAGQVLRVAGTARDVTERKHARQSLIESEERFRLLSKASTDAIWDWDLATNSLWWNEGLEAQFGYRRSEFGPTIDAWRSRVHPDDYAKMGPDIDPNAKYQNDKWSSEYRFRRKDGSYAYVLDRSYVIRDSAGKPVRIIGGITDITDRKQAEERLAEQAALLDVSQDAIIVQGLDNRILFWNRSAERIYGWTAAETLGRSAEELLYSSPADFHEAVATATKRGHSSAQFEHHRKDGTKLTVEGSMTVVRGSDGSPRSILAVNTDITERLGMEEQLRQSQRLEAVGQLTGGIAHDFNNLLTVILGSTELLVEQLGEDDKRRGLADNTMAAAQRGAKLTQRLLSFSRRQALDPKTVNVNQLLAGMESLLRRTLSSNISIELVLSKDLGNAMVDPSQLDNAVLNLCLNARDAMKDGGKLTIETADIDLDGDDADVAPGRYVMIAVTDTGTGIAPEILTRVFDPFFTTKEVGKGTGLGLSMVYGFVTQSEGQVKICSEPGRGTTVTLYLPGAVGAIAATKEPSESDPAQGGSETILMVEDDKLVRSHVENQLRALGYRVIAAIDGSSALIAFRADPKVDLLFTDVIMPGGMSGKQLADALRQIKPDLKVLFTSGYAEKAIVHQGRLDPGVRLLSKPYRRAELARMVRQALSSEPRLVP